MLKLLRFKVKLGFIVNPFYLYVIAFSLSIIVYLFGWSSLFPKLSFGLIVFFAVTFILFLITGYLYFKKKRPISPRLIPGPYLNDIVFSLIIVLCCINVIYMGYLPFFDRSHNYREFGMPVIDPLFNSLSIFFSVFLFHSILNNRKKRFVFYYVIILIIQALIFRRSAIIWIIISSIFLYIIYKREISLLLILTGVICFPLLSYCFGLYGNVRSNLTKSFVIGDLGASESFRKTGANYNHYMTYLYISSPLANLQENIDKRDQKVREGDLKEFIFYCLIPESFTNRLQKTFNLVTPSSYLISPNLIVGSFFMVGFYTMGWMGMAVMSVYLLFFILLCLYIIKRWDTCNIEVIALLSTAVSLLIFSNFLNRLDVILMLLVYPIIFHLIINRSGKVSTISLRISDKHPLL